MRGAVLFMRDAIFRVLTLTVLHILQHKLHFFLKHDFLFYYLFIHEILRCSKYTLRARAGNQIL